MIAGMRALLGLAAVAILIAAWMSRIDAKTMGVGSGVLVTNRWTGTVYVCIFAECTVVYPRPISK